MWCVSVSFLSDEGLFIIDNYSGLALLLMSASDATLTQQRLSNQLDISPAPLQRLISGAKPISSLSREKFSLLTIFLDIPDSAKTIKFMNTQYRKRDLRASFLALQESVS